MTWSQVQQKTYKISWNYLDDEKSQCNVACQGLYSVLYYVISLEL